MYPKNVMEVLGLRGGGDKINVTTTPSVQLAHWLEDAMIARADREPIRTYLDFLRRARAQFEAVNAKMGYWNAEASHSLGHDRWSVGWAGANLLSMASYLYALKSHGVTGCVLECGVFKGSSTACLSWVCNELDLKLFAADSFEGLPSAEGHYGTANFRGTLDEVKKNVSENGCPERVEYVQGWYSESLKDFNQEIALLWVDVDLQQSTVDVLENVYSKLAKNGVIFSDGFSEGVDFDGFKICRTGGEPAGFLRFFESHQIHYKALPGGAKGLALILPNCLEREQPVFNAASFQYLLSWLGRSEQVNM